jgi:putative SOS response-associated peptidase YedK
MCNLYTPVSAHRLNAQLGKDMVQTWLAYVAPLKLGPYIKQAGEVKVGQWGMIPPGSKLSKPFGATNNARRESLSSKKTYAPSWLNGMRCLIPAEDFTEPYYPGHDPKAKSISWRFARADGEPWALAGIWSEWIDPVTGENCDSHPLMSLMHRPEVDKTGQLLPATEQDKRAVVPVERDRWDEWLHGSVEQAEALIQLPPMNIFRHGAGDPAKNLPLPGPAAQGQIQASVPDLFAE